MADTDGRPVVAVLGGGYAGLTAAARMGEAQMSGAGPGARVVLVDAKNGFVERIRLHEVAAGTAPAPLAYRPFLAARGVDFIQARVVALDPPGRRLRLTGDSGAGSELAYDRLVYALGSQTDLGAVAGAAAHAHALDSVESATEITRRVQNGATRILVVGGGLTGIEAATELAERLPSAAVTIAMGASSGPDLRPGGLSPDGMAHVRRTFDRLGIAVVEGSRVARVDDGSAVLDDGRTVAFDLCLWAAGFRAPPLARESGLAVNARDQVVTDTALRSVSHPDIIAIGDAADVSADPAGSCRMSCATGRPMGEAASKAVAALLAGESPPVFGFAYAFRCISLGRGDGLIQFADQTDRPAAEIWSGARAARWKEYICRRTLQGVGFDPDLGQPPDDPPATRTALAAC